MLAWEYFSFIFYYFM